MARALVVHPPRQDFQLYYVTHGYQGPTLAYLLEDRPTDAEVRAAVRRQSPAYGVTDQTPVRMEVTHD